MGGVGTSDGDVSPSHALSLLHVLQELFRSFSQCQDLQQGWWLQLPKEGYPAQMQLCLLNRYLTGGLQTVDASQMKTRGPMEACEAIRPTPDLPSLSAFCDYDNIPQAR